MFDALHSEFTNVLCSDGSVVRASASGAVDSWFDSESGQIKLVFTASLLDAQRLRDSVENKPTSLLVALLGKALCGIPPSRCGRQMAGNS